MAQANAAVQASAVASLDHPDPSNPQQDRDGRIRSAVVEEAYRNSNGCNEPCCNATSSMASAWQPGEIHGDVAPDNQACLNDAVDQLRQMAKQAPDLAFAEDSHQQDDQQRSQGGLESIDQFIAHQDKRC